MNQPDLIPLDLSVRNVNINKRRTFATYADSLFTSGQMTSEHYDHIIEQLDCPESNFYDNLIDLFFGGDYQQSNNCQQNEEPIYLGTKVIDSCVSTDDQPLDLKISSHQNLSLDEFSSPQQTINYSEGNYISDQSHGFSDPDEDENICMKIQDEPFMKSSDIDPEFGNIVTSPPEDYHLSVSQQSINYSETDILDRSQDSPDLDDEETVCSGIEENEKEPSTESREVAPESENSVTPPPADRPVHECTECGKQYSTSSNLARHRHTNHTPTKKKARKCPHCNTRYFSKPAYFMHLATHQLNFRCPHCNKRFSRNWLLQVHVRIHTGEKPFKCPTCQAAFSDRSNLREHTKIHSEIKAYKCKRCGKAFALRGYLSKHIDTEVCKRRTRSSKK